MTMPHIRHPAKTPAGRAPRLALALAALCAAAPAAWAQQPPQTQPQQQAAFGLVQLMEVLGTVKSGEALFTEKRTSALLDRPTELSGRLSFQAPDSFTRETLKPTHEKLAVTGNQLTMSRGSRSRTVAVDSVPEASIIIEAIRGTLTGNRESLEKHFNVAVAGTARQWTLDLVPREPRLREQISQVRLVGQQALVREVAVNMPDGDRSVMTVEPTSTQSAPTAGAAN